MRSASVKKPVSADDEERAEDDRVLGLGLDADAVRALDVAADDRPADADEEHDADEVGAERVAPRTCWPCRNFSESGQLVVDLEHHGDDEQADEAEVDAASA